MPPGAGVGSALGFLRAPFSFEANRSVFMAIGAFDAPRVRALFAEMEAEAARFVRGCDADAPIACAHRVYMRYAGQGWEIPVALTPEEAREADPAVLLAHFERDYARLFGRTVAGMEAEATVWSVNAATPPAEVARVAEAAPAKALEPMAMRDLYDADAGAARPVPVHARAGLLPGARLAGPAIVTEAETTVIVPAGCTLYVAGDGCLDIRLSEDAP